mmetsp:Transcript_18123/g.49451  ORF Transcript_18123/g.49451 Transcript_18123/m.49451 type:complete len:423 (+) Transcript_18123:37-1305(+)
MRISILLCITTAGTVDAFQPTSSWTHHKKNRGSSIRLDATTSSYSTSSRREFVQSAATAAAATFAVGSSIVSPVVAVPDVATASSSAAASVAAIDLPPLGLGAWAWGDSFFWGYNPKEDAELKQVFDYAIEQAPAAVTLLDTAELYGFGRSESLIGQFSQDHDPSKVQVATKFAALPFRTNADAVVKACQASYQRLGGQRPIDLYQIHFPNSFSNAEYWDGLARAYDQGLVKAVGVSNYGVDATRACHAALAKRGIPLATNQIQLSLLYRHPLNNGLLQCCQDLGVQVLSYSPLALGMLTGKYTADNLPKGPRKKVFEKLNASPEYHDLLATMKTIAAAHGESVTLSQVALNWARAKGTIPIPGARTLSQVQKNYGALTWTLSPEEERVLDSASAKVSSFLQPSDNPFPKVDKDTGLIMYDS